MNPRVIYDFGANNGDDVPYYLMKADLVVCVEANSELCERIRKRFQREITDGHLVIENCVLTDKEHSGQVEFYISRRSHVLSHFLKPPNDAQGNFEKVYLPSKTAVSIVEEYGAPYYIKIDIEHYDAQILRHLFEFGIRPPYISAESHSADVFSLLVGLGGYNSFKLVEGGSVSDVYSRRTVKRLRENDEVSHSFPRHSAGPFGNDIDGTWMSADDFLLFLALAGLGWKDIHATNLDKAETQHLPSASEHVIRIARGRLTGPQEIAVALALLNSAFRRAVKKLYRYRR